MLLESILLAGGGYGLWRYRSRQHAHMQTKLAIIKDLSQRILHTNICDGRVSVQKKPPVQLGADTRASNALDIVWRYLRERKKNSSKAAALPSCSSPFFHMSCKGMQTPREAEIVVCEELVCWLAQVASGVPDVCEVSSRLDLYRQILMRPETFEWPFLDVLAQVCEHLDKLVERLSTTVRNCAQQMDYAVGVGKVLLDNFVPVLLFAITNILPSGDLPFLSMDALAEDAVNDERSSGQAARYKVLWEKDTGKIFCKLLCSPQFRRLKGDDPNSDALTAGAVQDEWVSLRHAWMDASDGRGGSLERSGLCAHFRSADFQDLHLVYLDLYKNLDSFILFLSTLEYYRHISNIAGDAAMCYLREGLHHLLRELELAMTRVYQLECTIMEVAKHKLAEILRSAKGFLDTPTHTWAERLQHVDQFHIDDNFRAMLITIRKLRFLSSEARLPALQASFTEGLNQLMDITASTAFAERCAIKPPQASLKALKDSPLVVQEVVDDSNEGALWSVEHCFTIGEHLLDQQQLDSLLISGSSVGEAVDSLNNNSIKCPGEGNFCIVKCDDALPEKNLAVLHMPNKKDSALNAVGLGATSWKRSLRISFHEEADLGADPLPSLSTPPMATNPVPISTPDAPPLAPVATAPTPAQQVNDEEISDEEEGTFYECLCSALQPLMEDDHLTVMGIKQLLDRAEGLTDETVEQILSILSHSADAPFGSEAVQTIGRLVAHKQSGCSDLANVVGCSPHRLPRLRDIVWDSRKRRVRVEVPFT